MSGRAHAILVVDGDPSTARGLVAALPADSFRVVAAADPTRALAILGQSGVDVLVSELVLPGASGLHFLVEACRRHPEVPRIVVTAVEEFASAVAAINEAEVVRFLRKPVEGSALRAAVFEAVDRADASREVSRAREATERRRAELLDLESDHPGITTAPAGPEGYLLPKERLREIAERLRGTPVGERLAHVLAAGPEGTSP